MSMKHYTGKKGYNAIRSQVEWLFKAIQPKKPENPVGAYFTTLSPDAPNFSVKTRLPKDKQDYIFCFEDVGDLELYPGGKGRHKNIFFSSEDYTVVKIRQGFEGTCSNFLREKGDDDDS